VLRKDKDQVDIRIKRHGLLQAQKGSQGNNAQSWQTHNREDRASGDKGGGREEDGYGSCRWVQSLVLRGKVIKEPRPKRPQRVQVAQ